MNRRRLVLSAAGAGLAVSGLAGPSGLVALAATDDELAYASFGQAAELLLKDFYAKTAAAKLVARWIFARGQPKSARFSRFASRSTLGALHGH